MHRANGYFEWCGPWTKWRHGWNFTTNFKYSQFATKKAMNEYLCEKTHFEWATCTIGALGVNKEKLNRTQSICSRWKVEKKRHPTPFLVRLVFFTWTQDLLMSPFVIIFNNGFTSLEKWKFNEAGLSLCFHKGALISD